MLAQAQGSASAGAAAMAGMAAGATGTGAAAAVEGATEQAQQFTLDVINDAPDGGGRGNFDRTTVGIGEENSFSAINSGGGLMSAQDAATGTWSCSGGSGNLDGSYYNWQAPGTPGTYEVSFTLNGYTATTTMTVLAPNDITASVNSTLSPDHAGAGMLLELEFQPTTVSFSNVQWYEQPGGATGSGYFDGNTMPHGSEQGAGRWISIGQNNDASDRAEMGGWPGAYGPGTHVWSIPTLYRAAGGPQVVFHTSTQTFEILNAQGDSQISKFDHTTQGV
jgi:hypothetical protein